MAIEVSCSSCGEEFRVKDEAAGKSFKCKLCGAKVRIPEVEAEDDEELDDFPPPRRRSRDDDDEEEERPKRRKKRSSAATGQTLGPAIGLYVTGSVGLLISSVITLGAILDPNGDNSNKPPPGADPSEIIGWAVGFYGMLLGLPLLALVVLAGAFCLQTRRAYPMALTACIIASIPCLSPGCVLGMPFGIWGLVILNQEDVKRAFQ